MPPKKEPGETYWKLVHPIWQKLSIFDEIVRFDLEFEDAPLKARSLFAAHWCQSEVRNGGFYQFFYNSTGILAPHAVSSFQLLSMPQSAGLVQQAINWFEQPYPRERRARLQQLKNVEGKKQFYSLDDKFYPLIREENGGFTKAADAYAEA